MSSVSAAYVRAPIGIAQVSKEGCCLLPNDSFCRIIGISADDLRLRQLSDLFLDSPFRADRSDLDQIASQAQWMDCYVQHPGGTHIPVSLNLVPAEANGSEDIGYFLFLQDVSDNQQLSARLRESEHRLEMALERADLGLWDENIVTGQVMYSSRYLRMLGYTPADFEPTEAAWRATIHPDDRARVLHEFREYVEGRSSVYQTEYRLRTISGEYRHILSSGKAFERTTDGKVVRVLGTHLDITEYKHIQERLQSARRELEQRVEERTAALTVANEQLKQEIRERNRIDIALRESEERFRNLFENAPVCVLEVDFGRAPAGIIQTNQQTARIFGWASEELVSVPVNRLIPSRRTLAQIATVESTDTTDTICLDAAGQRRDGTRFPIRICAAVSSNRTAGRTIITVEDISAEVERRSEQEAIAEERRRIAREIHDGLAQDLAWLRLKARLWQDLVFQDPSSMSLELDGLREILDKNIRDVRRSIFSLRPLDLDRLGFFGALRQFVDDFADQNQLQIDLVISGPENTFRSNLELILFRIIQEALNNVGKHANATTVSVEINLEVADSVLFLRIQDDGDGFSPSTTHTDETVRRGHLGIRHMQERVEKLGGSFFLHSGVGLGTEIQVTLPTTHPRGYAI